MTCGTARVWSTDRRSLCGRPQPLWDSLAVRAAPVPLGARLLYTAPVQLTLLRHLLLTLLWPRPVAAEDGLLERYLDQLLHGSDDPGKPQFLIYPVAAYAPETRLEVGLSSLYLFRARRDPTNRLSEIPVYAFYTLNNQHGLWFDHAVFTHRSRVSLLGEGRLQDFPLKYYGIGIEAEKSDAVLVELRQILVRERVLLRLGESDLYLGPEVGLNAIGQVRFSALVGEEPVGAIPEPLPRGGTGTANVTVGAGLVYDTRHNPLNVREGAFGELAWLGSSARVLSEYSFSNLYLDLRRYVPFRERNVLAAQAVAQLGRGEQPFNELAVMGGDSLMRGYYVGRYRDRCLAAAQAELRFLPFPLGFTDRLGGAVFFSAGTVWNEWSALEVGDVRLAGGAGLRVLTFPTSDIFTRLDVGLTEDGTGVYIYVGEAF